MTIEEQVIDVIKSINPEFNVYPGTILANIQFDSLDIVNLELYLREEFQNEHIHLNLSPVNTVQDVIDAVKLTLPY